MFISVLQDARSHRLGHALGPFREFTGVQGPFSGSPDAVYHGPWARAIAQNEAPPQQAAGYLRISK